MEQKYTNDCRFGLLFVAGHVAVRIPVAVVNASMFCDF